MEFLRETYSPVTNTPTLATPNDRPDLLPCDKTSSSTPNVKRFTISELHRAFGFRTLSSWDTIYDIAQDTIEIVKTADPILEIRDVANINRSRRNKVPITRPSKFLHRVHMDIGYGDCTAVGGAKYCILLVDRATRKHALYDLRSLNHEEIIRVLDQVVVDMNGKPYSVITDFDNKILQGKVSAWVRQNGIKLHAAPAGRQNQNGLVERAWQTACNIVFFFVYFLQDFSVTKKMAHVKETVLPKLKLFKALLLVVVELPTGFYNIVLVLKKFTVPPIINWMNTWQHLICLIFDMMAASSWVFMMATNSKFTNHIQKALQLFTKQKSMIKLFSCEVQSFPFLYHQN